MADGSYCGQRTHTGPRQTRVPSLQEPRLVGNETTTSCNKHAFLLKERVKIRDLGKQSLLPVQTGGHWLPSRHPDTGDCPQREPWDARGEDVPYHPPHPLEGVCPPTPQVSLTKKFCWSVGHLLTFMKNSFRELNGGVGVGMRLGSDRNFSAACTCLTA